MLSAKYLRHFLFGIRISHIKPLIQIICSLSVKNLLPFILCVDQHHLAPINNRASDCENANENRQKRIAQNSACLFI
jgi:hypothetical protein